MERLKYKECEECKEWNECRSNCFNICGKPLDAWDEFNKYKSLEEQGLLLRLPYPLGTEYIYFADENDVDVYELDAEKIEVHMMPISKKVMYTIDCFEFFIEDFGKTVFLTKEEAEQALKQIGE